MAQFEDMPSHNHTHTSTKLLLIYLLQTLIKNCHAGYSSIKDDYPFFNGKSAKNFLEPKRVKGSSRKRIKQCIWDNFDTKDVSAVRKMLDVDDREFWNTHGVNDLVRWRKIHEHLERHDMEDLEGVKSFFECNEGVYEDDKKTFSRRGHWSYDVAEYNTEEAAECREKSRESFKKKEKIENCKKGYRVVFLKCEFQAYFCLNSTNMISVHYSHYFSIFTKKPLYNTLPLKLSIPWEKCQHAMPGNIFPFVRFKQCTCKNFGAVENDCLFGKTFSNNATRFCRNNPTDPECLTVQDVRGEHESFAFPKKNTPSRTGLKKL